MPTLREEEPLGRTILPHRHVKSNMSTPFMVFSVTYYMELHSAITI